MTAGYADIPDWYSPEAAAADSMFSIDDYGKNQDGPYQIVQPSYPAPRFLERYVSLGKALRECQTLCALEGRPYRVVRWGREGAGARGGVPCAPCARKTRARISRFPRRGRGCAGCLDGFPGAQPIAEFQPGGRRIVYDGCGVPHIVGKPNYIVSHTPFPRVYRREVYAQRYLQAVGTAHLLAAQTGRRVYLCSGFNADCTTDGGRLVPVVYVEPGGLTKADPNIPTGQVGVTPVSPAYFRELVAQSRGATYLPQEA